MMAAKQSLVTGQEIRWHPSHELSALAANGLEIDLQLGQSAIDLSLFTTRFFLTNGEARLSLLQLAGHPLLTVHQRQDLFLDLPLLSFELLNL
jgi:hypothetical protein